MAYSYDYVSYKVFLESDPMTTWQVGHAMNANVATFMFPHPMKIIIDANSSEFTADASTYSRLTMNLCIKAQGQQLYSIFKNRTTLPLLVVTPEQREGKWYGTAVFNGFLTNLFAGTYKLLIEVLDMDRIDGPDFAQAIVATYHSVPFELIRNNI